MSNKMTLTEKYKLKISMDLSLKSRNMHDFNNILAKRKYTRDKRRHFMTCKLTDLAAQRLFFNMVTLSYKEFLTLKNYVYNYLRTIILKHILLIQYFHAIN